MDGVEPNILDQSKSSEVLWVQPQRLFSKLQLPTIIRMIVLCSVYISDGLEKYAYKYHFFGVFVEKI